MRLDFQYQAKPLPTVNVTDLCALFSDGGFRFVPQIQAYIDYGSNGQHIICEKSTYETRKADAPLRITGQVMVCVPSSL